MLSDARVDAAHLHVGDDGALAGDTLTVRARGAFAGEPVDAAATLSTLAFARGRLDALLTRVSLRRGAPETVHAQLDTATLVFDGAAADLAPLAGRLSLTTPDGPVTLAFSDGTARYAVTDGRLEFTLPTLAAQLPDPAGTAQRLDVSGELAGELMTTRGTGAGRFGARAEGSRLDGRWWVVRDQARWLGAVLAVDRLDLDRWLPKSSPPAAQPAPLDAWRDLPVQLDVRVGRLRWQGVTVRDARLRLNAPADSAPR